MAFQEQLRQGSKMMTWHNRDCLLAQCKSKTNQAWQLQLSWQDPTGISNTPTSQIKTAAWRRCPPWFPEKIIKKSLTAWVPVETPDIDCILMGNNFLGDVLHFALAAVALRGKQKHGVKRTIKRSRKPLRRGETRRPSGHRGWRGSDYHRLKLLHCCYHSDD